eukprot:CAMPEP_0184343574 /NCGR_PEP_ID=MMETSP1089-20130417/12082_1 /TAXON_ID=38269 ORGANISM="Gloeochaete wittrockiana, Strain SAG46.84" /NCGR_SAMPLE_ID=MMETSP1089 /ASSEMBLY_ACC=CAM_ASM_000445 /LENGTH=117 /DNA_ID=CAMNT_0026672935 /DNA_START=143 /DNA_END=493 /DNA_ORIENTATION=-
MALFTRSMAGALNGNLGVVKTYLGEITDKSNQAAAFSAFSLSCAIPEEETAGVELKGPEMAGKQDSGFDVSEKDDDIGLHCPKTGIFALGRAGKKKEVFFPDASIFCFLGGMSCFPA